jgi:hypothetical protein
MKISNSVSAVIILALAVPAFAQIEPKLNYKEEQLVKDSIYYLEIVEENAAAIAKKSAPLKVGDAGVKIEDVKAMLEQRNGCLKYLKYVDDRLKQLPLDHSKVKPLVARSEAAKTSVADSEKKLNELLAGLQKVVDQGADEGYKSDFARLKEINKMYYDEQIFQRRPDEAAAIIRQIPAVKEERAGIAKKYADLLKQTTPESRDMNGVLAYCDEVLAKFEKAGAAFAAAAPDEIARDLESANTMARQGVENKNPLFFGEHGGINQRLNWAESRYLVLAALAPDAASTAAARKKIDATRSDIARTRESLIESIIAANTVPAESYNQADRGALLKLVESKWAEAKNPAQVLKVGINSKAWQRVTRWEYRSKTWTLVDYSWIQGFVVIKLDEKTAGVFYINIDKNHVAQDALAAYYFNDPKLPVQAGNKILLQNIK